MLIFNGKKFAKTKSEFVGSLFEGGSTCAGYYKRTKTGIQFFDHQHNLRAFAVVRGASERFIVSAGSTDNGPRYMFSTDSLTEKWLGIEGFTFAGERSAINNALETIGEKN